MVRGNGLVALALSMLLACSDPRAGTLPSASPTPSPAPGSSTPPGSPQPDDLVRAVETYYETIERTSANPAAAGDLAALIHPACACRQTVELLRRLARERHRLLFAVTVTAPRVAELGRTNGTVFVEVTQSSGSEVDVSGSVVRRLPASRGTYAVDLVRPDSRWLVQRITRRS